MNYTQELQKLVGLGMIVIGLGLLAIVANHIDTRLFEDGSYILGSLRGCLPFAPCNVGG